MKESIKYLYESLYHENKCRSQVVEVNSKLNGSKSFPLRNHDCTFTKY